MKQLVRVMAVLLLVAGAACSDDDSKDGQPATTPVPGGIGLPGDGQVAWHFLGRIDQDALNFTAYGFLTEVDGLKDDSVFVGGGERNEDTAVFSVVMRSEESKRSKLNNVTVVDVTGTATIYVN